MRPIIRLLNVSTIAAVLYLLGLIIGVWERGGRVNLEIFLLLLLYGGSPFIVIMGLNYIIFGSFTLWHTIKPEQ